MYMVVQKKTHKGYLARSANFPEGLYILLPLISFFFNDLSDTNYLRIHWTDFRNIFTK